VLRVKQTFEEDTWLFGNSEIMKYLQDERVLALESVRQDTWSEMGSRFFEDNLRTCMDTLFMYPKVHLAADLRDELQVCRPRG